MITSVQRTPFFKPGLRLLFCALLSAPALMMAQVEVIEGGKVGIGTPTPTAKLDIDGTLRWRAATTPGHIVTVSDALGNLTTTSIGASTIAGDLSGTLSNAQIVPNAVGTPEIANGAVTGTKIAQNGATTGQVLEWNGTSWVPAPDDNNVYTAGAGIGIAGNVITNTGDTNGADDITTATTAGGDLSGSYPAPLVDGLQGNPVSATAPTTGQILKWNGSAWAPATDDGTTYTAGTGISIAGNVITNTGDVSNTNEIQDLSLTGNTLSLTSDATTVNLAPYLDNTDAQTLSVVGSNLTISGGNTVTIPSAPVSSVNGLTGAVALDLSLAGSTLSLTGDATTVTLPDASSTNEIQDLSISGGILSLTGDATTVTLPDASSTNELQTLSVASNTVTLSNGGGNFTIAGTGTNTVSTAGSTITINGTDNTTNEGVVGVGAGGATTSIITSNSSGATGVTLAAGAGITLTETPAANGGTITIASTGGSSNWTVSGADIYRLSNVSVGTTSINGAKFTVDGSFNGTCLRATGGTIPSFGAIIKATGTSTTGSLFGIDIDGSATGNMIHRFRNTNNGATTYHSQVQVEVGGAAGGNPMVQFVVPSVQTWSSGLDNSDADKYKISASNALATSTALTIQTNGNVGVGTTAPFVVLHAGGTGAIGMPSGTTAERPVLTGAPRMIRFNSEIGGFELGEPSKGIWYRLTSLASPTLAVSGPAGVGATVVLTVGAGSNDVTGSLTLTTGSSGLAVGDLFTMTFNKPYGGTKVIATVTPADDNAASQITRWRVNSQTNASITVRAVTALDPNKAYVFNYVISQ